MPPPCALLVDIGETLFRERPMDWCAATDALAADPRFRARLPDARAVEASQRERPDGWSVLGWLRTMLAEALAREAEILVWEKGVRMEPMPGVREALAAFRAAGVPVGAVSNTRFSEHAWMHVLRARGLAVDFVVTSADVGARKPDPLIFRAALHRLRLPPADVWFVGDTYGRDVRGTTEAGLFPVWLGGPRNPLPSGAVAADWAEVVALWKSRASPGVS